MTAALQTGHRHRVNGQTGWAQFLSSWRRDSDEVRKDQLATAAMGLVSAVIGTAVALFARGTTAAVLVGLLTLCVTPGFAFACWQVTQNRLTRGITVLAGSLTWTILIATSLAFLQVTRLSVLIALTAGIGGLGSAAFFLIDHVACRLSSHRYPAPLPDERLRPDRAHQAVHDWSRESGRTTRGLQLTRPDLGFRPFSADREFRDGPPDRKSYAQPHSHYPKQQYRRNAHRAEPLKSPFSLSILTTLLTIAAGLFAFSVVQARGHAVDSYGLLPLLGFPFFIAAALTVAVLVFALRSIRATWPVAVAALGLLLVEFNGTPMMLDPTPLSSWTFKHYGVVDYVFHGLPLNDPRDIYQQWPGFFASVAGLERLSGRSDLSFGNWAQLFFEALDALVIFAIARRLVANHPAVPYVTVALFVTANWEGQFYFSPQSTAFLLALLMQFFVLSMTEPERLRRLFRGRRWLLTQQLEIMREPRTTRIGSAAQSVGLIGLFAAIVVTHQLSPFMVFGGLVCLWILGVIRQPVVMLTLTVIVIGYPALHLAAVSQNSLLDGFSFSNLTGGPSVSQPSQQQQLASLLARSISLGLWAVTAISLVSYRRRLGQVIIPAILCAVPFGFALVSNYQGEAIYRVFLFSSPWCALIIAKRLADFNRLPMMSLILAGAWTLFAALGSAQAQDFGMYPIMQVQPSEIAASDYFLNNAPDGAGLVLAVSDFPTRGNFRYAFHNFEQSQNDLGLDQIAQYTGAGLSRTNAKSLAVMVAHIDGGRGYLAVGPSMESDSEYYGVYSRGTIPNLVKRLEASPYWKTWYRNGDSIVFEAFPQGRFSGKTR